MASGTIFGYTDAAFLEVKVEWESVADNDLNQSAVTASLYYKIKDEYRNDMSLGVLYGGEYSITINGETTRNTNDIWIFADWTCMLTVTEEIKHDVFGAKTIEISADGGIAANIDFSQTHLVGVAVLDKISRATIISSLACDSIYFTGGITYTYLPRGAELYNRCVVDLVYDGDITQAKDIKLGQKAISQQTGTVTLAESELSTIYNKLPSASKGTLRFTFLTYTDSGYGTQVGDAAYKEITLYIPDNNSTKPTAYLNIFPFNSNIFDAPFNSMYIKGKTKVGVAITNGVGKYGASIEEYMVTIDGKEYMAAQQVSDYIAKDGEITITGRIRDSRGFTRTYSQTATFLPYTNPRVFPASGESAVVCARCDASGTITEDGTYLKIKAKRSYSSLNEKNSCAIRYRYKGEGETYSDWITILQASDASDEVTTGALLGGTLLTTSSYVVQVGVIDALGETDFTTVYISTASIYMHRAGSRRSLGIGKYVEDDNVIDIAEDLTTIFRGKVVFMGEIWNTLNYSADVVEGGIETGRYGGKGIFYRESKVENQVSVAFNVKFTTRDSVVQVASEAIPNPPQYDVYAMCPVAFSTGARGVAIVNVSPRGTINICEVYKMPGATLSVGDTVEWIDGYINYLIQKL